MNYRIALKYDPVGCEIKSNKGASCRKTIKPVVRKKNGTREWAIEEERREMIGDYDERLQRGCIRETADKVYI